MERLIYSLNTGVHSVSLSPLMGFIYKLVGRNPENILKPANLDTGLRRCDESKSLTHSDGGLHWDNPKPRLKCTDGKRYRGIKEI